MDEDWSQMTERVIDLTLEIIYLLTGEDYQVVKKISGEPLSLSKCLRRTSPITAPPPHCPMKDVISAKKILEANKKITELLTGEVPIRCQDVAVYFSMEEWEYLEGHKELYKEVTMASQPALTSPDASSNENPPERCHLDSTQKNLNIPHDHQVDHPNPHLHQGEIIDIKVEREVEEETLVSGDQPSIEEGEIIIKSEQEEASLHMEIIGHCARMWNISEAHWMLSPGYKVEDNNNVTQSSTEENSVTNMSHPEESSVRAQKKQLSFAEIGVQSEQQRSPKGERPYSCSECGKYFTKRGSLHRHQKSHTGERPHTCSECGKCFAQKGNLLRHLRSHTGERHYSCSECKKLFSRRGELLIHMRNHTGECPFPCPTCGKRFNDKRKLVKHQRYHSGERPYSCPECDKSYFAKAHLLIHQRSHTGERPFFCTECGKCFTDKGKLVKHQKSHTGKRPFSCLLCGKDFTAKANLIKHQTNGEKCMAPEGI